MTCLNQLGKAALRKFPGDFSAIFEAILWESDQHFLRE
jgi:hypothetical protein